MNAWWQSLEERERWFVGGLGVFLVVFLFYLILIEPLFSTAREYREKTAMAERELSWMREAVTMLPKNPGAPTGATDDSLTVIVDRTSGRHRLVTASTRQVPPDGLRVKLDDASFDSIVSWLGDLHSRFGVQIEAANITQAGSKGTANANFTLRRPQG